MRHSKACSVPGWVASWLPERPVSICLPVWCPPAGRSCRTQDPPAPRPLSSAWLFVLPPAAAARPRPTPMAGLRSRVLLPAVSRVSSCHQQAPAALQMGRTATPHRPRSAAACPLPASSLAPAPFRSARKPSFHIPPRLSSAELCAAHCFPLPLSGCAKLVAHRHDELCSRSLIVFGARRNQGRLESQRSEEHTSE